MDFPAGSRFAHPLSGELCPVYDTSEQSWQHLNFFQYECYLHAWVPRVEGGTAGGVKTVAVPWARPDSGFTLLMEALMVLMAQAEMPITEVGRVLSINPPRIWRVLHAQVDRAYAALDVSEVKVVTLDETSLRKGHEYMTVVCEPTQGDPAHPTRVLAVTEGKDAAAVQAAVELLRPQGLVPEQIQYVSSDLSAAYQKAAAEQFPQAQLVSDHFHVVQLISKAVDEVRRRESAQFPELLKGTRYLWLKNGENLSESQRAQCAQLCRSKLQTAKAYMHLESYKEMTQVLDGAEAEQFLKWWYNWVCHSRIPEMIKVAKTIKAHWKSVVAYLHTRLTNGPAEAINGLIQNAKRKARGFRSFVYFRTIIYLLCSKLEFNLPCPVPVDPQQTA